MWGAEPHLSEGIGSLEQDARTRNGRFEWRRRANIAYSRSCICVTVVSSARSVMRWRCCANTRAVPASTIATRFFTGWSARRPTSNARRRPQVSLPGRWNSTSFIVRRSRRGARSAGGARTPSGVDGELGADALLAPFEFQLAVELALNDPLHDAHAELGRKPPLGCRCTNLRRHRNPQQGTTS